MHGVRAPSHEPEGGAEEVREECRTSHQSCSVSQLYLWINLSKSLIICGLISHNPNFMINILKPLFID